MREASYAEGLASSESNFGKSRTLSTSNKAQQRTLAPNLLHLETLSGGFAEGIAETLILNDHVYAGNIDNSDRTVVVALQADIASLSGPFADSLSSGASQDISQILVRPSGRVPHLA